MYVVLDDWQSWEPRFRPWVEKRFSPAVLAALNANVEPSLLGWLDDQQADVDGHFEDSVALFESEMLANFEGVRVIHASRLSSVDPIRQGGLRAWTADDLRQQAADLPHDVTESDRLKLVVEQCNPDHRGGYVYSFASLHHALGLWDGDDGRLPSFCVHGGEFLAAVRQGLGEDAIGPPGETRAYFFACDLPWSTLDIDDVRYLARTMLSNILTNAFLDGNFSMHGEHECLTTRCDIRPEHITAFADVEHLSNRTDLSPAVIPWEPFTRHA